ncbi:uncharacterized protein B0P05DRAFT_533504 [Gilbertella persicaria]|uniref:uncharacterized protein n=1 Tax=Gilbertella persicaria TaxID=101096 RepID=UPI00221F1A73|nr:uncharacterized protein B0P05DRAFT_533504 [Gilbertella persicaria]KAI8087052.1 hypothetical protein B0P05DRAFT_533504 [Gilbertella persicaria]
MADYWVSQQRHWCKYCKKYIQNNKPSIALHEAGGAHKTRVEQFMRNIFKKGRQDQEDAANIRREIQRIEMAAAGAVALGTKSSMPAPLPRAPSSSAPDKVLDYHIIPNDPAPPTIQELRQQAIAAGLPVLQGREEWALNKEVAKVGEWETVEPVAPPPPPPADETNKKQAFTTHDQRPEFQDDDEHDEENLHSFKIREKEFPADLDIAPEEEQQEGEVVTFKKRKLGSDESGFKARKKKPLRKK